MEKYKNRKEVPEKYKWDLTSFYKNEDDFNKEYEKAKSDVEKIKEYVGCTKDDKKLLEFLNFDYRLVATLENLYIYSYLINDQELGNSKSIERKAKTEKLLAIYGTNVSFFNPELLQLSEDKYKKLFNNKGLLEYKEDLDDIYREKEHILSEKEEIIINELTSAMDHYDDMSSTMLNSEHNYGYIEIDGKEEMITSTNYSKIMQNDNREVRKNAREKYYGMVDQYGASSAQFLDSYVKSRSTVCRLKKYEDSFSAKRFGLNMPISAYNALVTTVEDNVKSYQRYLKLLKKSKKLDKLYQYDLGIHLNDSNKEYSIEDAQELCLKAIEPLGEDYLKHFKKIFDNRYIDYAQYKGKCSGGYSFAPLDNDSRILMSYNYDLNSVSTIIHEGGHNVHHQYLKESNPLQYREVPSLVAEVASLTNECLLSSYLAKNGTNKEEKLSGLSNIIGVINSNLFGAVREGKMEEEFYKFVDEGNTITKDYMDKLTIDSFKKYYGNEVELDNLSGASWMRRSHYFMFFYLYAYSFSISIASYVASEILKGNTDMLDKYLEFLKTGSNLYPTDIFKVLGVDITDKKVYESAIKYYNDLLDEYEKISKED